MTKINMTFSEEELARMAAEFEQKINEEEERLAKLKDIYNQLFGSCRLLINLPNLLKMTLGLNVSVIISKLIVNLWLN